jgi:hypothetical protein
MEHPYSCFMQPDREEVQGIHKINLCTLIMTIVFFVYSW